MKKCLHIINVAVFLFSINSKAQENSNTHTSIDIVRDITFPENEVTETEEINDNMVADFHDLILGIRFMPTISSLKVQNSNGNSVEGEIALSYGYGGLLGYNLTKHTGIQLEVLYSTLSQKYQDFTLERQIDLNYVNVPLLISINSNRTNAVNINVVVGPQLGLNVGSSITTKGSNNGFGNRKAVLAVKNNDLGIAYGGGLDFGLNADRSIRLDIGFRGVNGLIDISDRSQPLETGSYYILQKKKTQTYSGYIGLTFLL